MGAWASASSSTSARLARSSARSLPPEIQTAIKAKKVLVGMDREMVLLSKGRPESKIREAKDGVETEDWIYGKAPGTITFVTFEGDKVIRVKEMYAGLQ